MKYIYIVLIVSLLSCSRKSNNANETNDIHWIEYSESFEVGFTLKFNYPNTIILADIIDNCRCVGEKTEYYNENEASEKANTNQWCICLQDTADYSIKHLISSWKTVFSGEVIEKRDTLTIGNLKALRVTLKCKEPCASYRQLIYLKKFSTLFEIMNVNESTSKDFEVFCESIKIEEYTKH